MKKLFGTDGIRGVANKDLTIELACRLGEVFGMIIKQNSLPGPWSVVVGRDTRSSCEGLEEALSTGLTAQGVNVSLAGIIPTPGLTFITRTLGFNAGVMISASHNPAEYNGIKLVSHNGFKLTGEKESEIERLMEDYNQIHFPDIPRGLIKTRSNTLNKVSGILETDRGNFAEWHESGIGFGERGNIFYCT